MMVRGVLGQWGPPAYGPLVDPHNTDALVVRVGALEARLSDLESYCKAIVKHVETDGEQEAS